MQADNPFVGGSDYRVIEKSFSEAPNFAFIRESHFVEIK